jgi:hypothetical protein
VAVAGWRILSPVGHSNGSTKQRGNVAVYLLFSIVASVAVGYGVYVFIRDRKVAVADDVVAEPAPMRQESRPAPMEPMEPTPIAEVGADSDDPAERGASEPNLVVTARDAVVYGKPGVAGGLAASDVEQTIQRYTVRYERCMRRAKERGATLGGSLRLTLVIAADGNVDYATGKPTNVDEELAGCVVDIVKKLRFARSGDGAKVKVVYPIAFVAASSGDPLE